MLKASGIVLIAAGVAVVEIGSQRARRAEAVEATGSDAACPRLSTPWARAVSREVRDLSAPEAEEGS